MSLHERSAQTTVHAANVFFVVAAIKKNITNGCSCGHHPQITGTNMSAVSGLIAFHNGSRLFSLVKYVLGALRFHLFLPPPHFSPWPTTPNPFPVPIGSAQTTRVYIHCAYVVSSEVILLAVRITKLVANDNRKCSTYMRHYVMTC